MSKKVEESISTTLRNEKYKRIQVESLEMKNTWENQKLQKISKLEDTELETKMRHPRDKRL